MSNKMIRIKDVKVSEDTIVEALQKHYNFDAKPDFTELNVGDAVETPKGLLRFIVEDGTGCIIAIDTNGYCRSKQRYFGYAGYRKVGRMRNFVKDCC